MSYASHAAHAANYRELEILSASPERLVVLMFEQLVVQLERARLGAEREDLALMLTGLNKANLIVGELLATLDFEKGGAIAEQLADLYQFLLVELLDAGKTRDVTTLRRLGGIASELRDGFTGAAEQLLAVQRSA